MRELIYPHFDLCCLVISYSYAHADPFFLLIDVKNPFLIPIPAFCPLLLDVGGACLGCDLVRLGCGCCGGWLGVSLP